MAEKQPEKVETAPDPEEDDLDDLDDVLDSFAAKPQPKPSSSPTPSAPAGATTSGPGRPPAPTAEDASNDSLPSDEEMASQLQAGMSSLISELDANPEMQREFEKMMQELIAAGSASSDKGAVEHIGKAAEALNLSSQDDSKKTGPGGGGGAAAAAASSAGGAGKKPADFNDTIRRTMERMQASGDAATAASTSKAADGFDNDLLAQMMKELGESGGDGDADFNSLLMNMMAQLTHKEILYDPMKELHEKFPSWIEKNKGKCSAEDMQRYEEQQKVVAEIVARFERKGYSDDDAGDREYIVDRMQKMQAAGAPPPDLVGDMSAAQEALGGLGDFDGGCPMQ